MGSGTVAEFNQFNPPTTQDIIVQTIASDNIFLNSIPKRTINTDRLEWWLETEEDTSVGARAINGTFNEGSGQINKQNATVKLYGGHMDLDKVLVETDVNGLVGRKLDMKLRSLGIKLTHDMIYGDSSTNPNEVNGLYRLLAESNDFYTGLGNIMIADTASMPTLSDRDKAMARAIDDAPAGLQITSLNVGKLTYALDQAIARMPVKPDMILCGSQMRLLLKMALNESKLVTVTQDMFGQNITLYDGIPIVQLPKYANGTDIMAFNETSPDGSSHKDCGSILLAKFGTGSYYSMFMNNNVQVLPARLKENNTEYRWTIEFNVNHYIASYDSVYRIAGIRR